MADSAPARAYHDELFPGQESLLAHTDPELTSYFEAFAYDEALVESELDVRTRLMTQLAALIACQGIAQYRVFLGAALTAGVTPIEIKEIVYQAVPYVGMAKALDSLQATNEALAAHGVELPLPGQSTTTPRTRAERGLAVQREIVGEETVTAMHATAPVDQVHIQRLLTANCFGDTYTRTGIDVPTRELLTLSMLVALGGCDPQVKGHVAANLHVGNNRARLIDVVTGLLPYIGYPRTLNALRAIDEIAPATHPEP